MPTVSCVIKLLALVACLSLTTQARGDASFELNTHCPKGFERVSQNRCELRSLYQFSDSTQNRGVGGTQTGLPSYRDGFSPQQIDLGRYLFFDPILSGNGHLSCASCHDPGRGFTDGRAVSVGADGERGSRSAPTLWNVAFLSSFFWDGRSTSLEQQAIGPLYSQQEMGNSPQQLLESLNANPTYVRLFGEVFETADGVTLDAVYMALAAFQSSLISLNSRYDRYAHGDHSALTEIEIAGMNVFRSFVARCSECHTPPTFTNNQLAVIGAPELPGNAFDVGAETTTKLPKLRGAFKVPTLRNIEKTGPYMHSGVFKTLRQAAEFYNKGRGHSVPKKQNLTIHWHINEPDLSDFELDALVAFMRTLTDQKFMPDVPQVVPSGLAPITSTLDAEAQSLRWQRRSHNSGDQR